MMFSRRFLLCCTMLILYSTQTTKGQWLSRPANLSLCAGDNAVLNWNYADNPDVSMIFWIFMGTGQTMMAWYDANDQTKVYPDYSGRVRMINGTKAGIVLHNVTKSDSGNYQIEVAGPGWRDVAHLDVYTDKKQSPFISVNNREITTETVVDISPKKKASITVSTRHDLHSNISLIAGGSNFMSCSEKKTCSDTLDMSKYEDANISIIVTTICGQHELSFVLVSNYGADGNPVIIAVVIVIVLLIAIGVPIFVWFVYRKRQLQKRKLSQRQDRFIKLSCFYKVFTKMKRWKSSEHNLASSEQLNELEKAAPDTSSTASTPDIQTPLPSKEDDSAAPEITQGEQELRSPTDEDEQENEKHENNALLDDNDGGQKPEDTWENWEKFKCSAANALSKAKGVITYPFSLSGKKVEKSAESEPHGNTQDAQAQEGVRFISNAHMELEIG